MSVLPIVDIEPLGVDTYLDLEEARRRMTPSAGCGQINFEIIRVRWLPGETVNAMHPLTSALVAARAAGVRTSLPGIEVYAIDRATACQVQLEVVEELGTSIAGWKVAVLADHDVITAPIIAERLIRSPVSLPPSIYGLGGVECEVAFEIARTPIATRGGFSGDEILASLGGAPAAMEVLDSRCTMGLTSPRNAMVADFLANGALVIGERVGN